MKIPDPLLSPAEIASTVYDSGHIRDRGNAQRLEHRIDAWAAAKANEANTQALIQSARTAQSALAGIRGANNRAAAARIVRAIESLLPHDAKFREGYALGYSDCAEDKPNRTKRDDAMSRAR